MFFSQFFHQLGNVHRTVNVHDTILYDAVVHPPAVQYPHQRLSVCHLGPNAFAAGCFQFFAADLSYHAAPVDEAVMGGQLGKLIKNVAGNQHGDLPFPVQLQDQLPHFHNALGVQAVDWFVQHKKIGVAAQRHGDSQALPHSQGKILGFFLAGVFQSHQAQKLGDVLLTGKAQYAVLHFQIVHGGHVRVEGRGLHHGSHAAPRLDDTFLVPAFPIEGVFSGARLLQAAYQPDESGFSRAVFSRQAVNRPFGHPHSQTVQSFEAPVMLAELIGFQHVFHDCDTSFLIWEYLTKERSRKRSRKR